MSNVIAAPELINTAATDLASIGSNLSAAHLAAAAPTTGVIPAAADEVSAGIAHLFSQHAGGYQALAGQASAFHEQFVQQLNASAHSYAATEATNAGSLRPLNAAGYMQNPPPPQVENPIVEFPIFQILEELAPELFLLIALLLLL
jgi:hypothetical protein